MSFFNSGKSKNKNIRLISVFLFLFIFGIMGNKVVMAQGFQIVQDPIVAEGITQNTVNDTLIDKTDTFWDKAWKAIQKAGSIAFQKTLASTLNKIAYDAANYIGSGGEGQAPLFVTQNLGDYLTQSIDEATGEFIESFVNNLDAADQNTKCWDDWQTCYKSCEGADSESLSICSEECSRQATSCASKNANSKNTGKTTPSFNVCSPSSLEVKVRIGLGLVEQTRASAPNCTASAMVKSWKDDINKKIDSFKDPNYLSIFKDIFDPRSNDLGIYVMAQSDLSSKANFNAEVTKSDFITNGGWLDVRNIAGAIKGVPGDAQRRLNEASELRQQALGKTTEDILVDTANVFLNQLYIASLNNLLSHLGEKSASSASKSSSISYAGDPSSAYGERSLKEQTNVLLNLKFDTQADYDILSELAICVDPKNPGPDNCVIDSGFMQAISEKKTVAEAISAGYLSGERQITADSAGDYHNSYALRNISILRKYRIVPVGWEEAANRVSSSTNPRKATLNDLVSCFSENDDYNSFSNGFGSDHSWCAGLIDPNWVLKAPLNYCKKKGIGAQILSSSIIPSVSNSDTPSSISISRADEYCADNETCIKEKSDGSCDAYGYCNAEKRIWNFGTDYCQPVNNTCQTFTSERGQSVSYLKNTLEYANCNKDNAGCRQYSWLGDFNASKNTVSWNSNYNLFLNNNLGTCTSDNVGCTELVRLKPTWGANLVMNSAFSNDNIGDSTDGNKLNDWSFIWTEAMNNKAKIVDSSQSPGGSQGPALKLEAEPEGSSIVSGRVYSNNTNSLIPKNFQLIPGYSYQLSADIYIESGDRVELSIGSDGAAVEALNAKNNWQRISVTRLADGTFSAPEFSITGFSDTDLSFYIQDIKFEVSNLETGYSDYGYSKIYEKLIPAYLEKTCYEDVSSAVKDYRLKTNAPAVCGSYARKCNKDEVGCALYSRAEDDLNIAARTVNSDYCSEQCLGYSSYIAKSNYFNLAIAENLIPEKAISCSAKSAGCNEFTNLDSLAAGGEGKEYYISLKQCIKPDTAKCSSFYTWENQAGGPQLKSYSLQKDINNNPLVTASDSSLCNENIFKLPISDPKYNADCREFYNAAGQVSYHLLARTITCSDNCHAYRLSERNIDKSVTMASNCSGTNKHWDASTNECLVCLNGGVWRSENNACVYQAIPGEGESCSAQDNGCREYNGNQGSNVQTAAYYDFEHGLNGWFSNCQNGLSVSTISNNKDGHSLFYNNNAANCEAVSSGQIITRGRLIEALLADENKISQLNVSNLVKEGSAYTLKFLAKANYTTNLSIYFWNKTENKKSYFNASSSIILKGDNEWNLYQVNLTNLDHPIGADNKEVLAISGSGDFYLDNLILSEITDRYYLIKGSSQVPDVCSYDILGNYQGPEYNLGCSQYTDRDNLNHNLRQFSKLCADSAVGCEQMIDTKNFSSYQEKIWNDTDGDGACGATEKDCLKIEGDSIFYAVYNENLQCSSANKGCSRFGQKMGESTLVSWSDVYKLNNPDQYDKTLCGQESVGCEAWAKEEDSSSSYFKNPNYNVCQYRNPSSGSTLSGKNWFKIPVKRCDLDGNKKIDGAETSGLICGSNDDCASGGCLIDNNDYPCPTTFSKTIGLGGTKQVPTPNESAALCDANASGCTEYLDPLSEFSVNLVNNPNFKGNLDGWGSNVITWSGARYTVLENQQAIKLEKNKLYRFTVNGNNTGVKLEFQLDIKPLITDKTSSSANNSFGPAVKSLAPAAGQAVIFNSGSNDLALLSGGAANRNFEIKELVIDYQIESNIDKKSCTSKKFDNGCILFSERSVNSAAGITPNYIDPVMSEDGKTPITCANSTGLECSANILIKVRPDRTCAKWIDCVTYTQNSETKEKTCYALGECDRLNDQNECDNFTSISADSLNDKEFTADNDKNSSGYTLLNKYNLNQMREVGFDSNVHYDFEGESASSAANYSCLANPNNGVCQDTKLNKLIINEPEGTPTDYPAQGTTYLSVPADYRIFPARDAVSLTAAKNNNYYLNYLVNTKNSDVQAEVRITNASGTTLKDAVSGSDLIFKSASNSWKRVVNKFNLKSGTAIKIYFGSDLAANLTNTNNKLVYFDDINIEPVLEIGKDQYAAAECRLFSTDDSLTCLNKNKNTIKTGLEGYCLEHDQFNPNVCLLWYPVDKIASGISYSSGGYQGKSPLSYCTEADGNFTLVENREIEPVNQNGATIDICENNKEGVKISTNADPKYLTATACIGCSIGDNNQFCVGKWNIPKVNGDMTVYAKKVYVNDSDGSSDSDYYAAFANINDSDNINYFPLSNPAGNPGPGQSSETHNYFLNLPSYRRVLFDFADANPNSARQFITLFVKVGSGAGNGISSDAWYEYNGTTTLPEKTTAKRNFNDAVGAPTIMVYENGVTTGSTSLKLLPGTLDDGDKTNLKPFDREVYHFTCNQFNEVVKADGTNHAWADRVNNNTSSMTPIFLDRWRNRDQVKLNLKDYVRNSYDIPYGASYSSSNSGDFFRDAHLSFQDYSDYAGRPYGCAGNNCLRIGYCSNATNTYCMITEDDNDPKFCGTGGTCNSLWKVEPKDASDWKMPSFYKAEYVLNNIFLTNDAARDIPQCANNIRGVDDWCAVFPAISNVKLYYGNNSVQFSGSGTSAPRGIYRLEFNSSVDLEQQPLKSIYIEWGDGTNQTISGQDDRPDVKRPHVIYHYYSNNDASKTIKIKVTDNWGKYKEYVGSAGAGSSLNPPINN